MCKSLQDVMLSYLKKSGQLQREPRFVHNIMTSHSLMLCVCLGIDNSGLVDSFRDDWTKVS